MELPVFANVYNKSGEELLPHRPPFLFVDTLISADETGALGEYTYTEEKNSFFKGHFPDFPVVPGVVLGREHGSSCRRGSRCPQRSWRQR